MKTRISKVILPFFIIFLVYACQKDKLARSIPQLLTRNEKIQMGKEWDNVQQQYQTLKIAIVKNDNDQESKIRLAQLFIREARITGEHGHYYPGALEMTDRVLANKMTEPSMIFLALVTKAGVQLSQHAFDQALATGKKALLYNQGSAQLYGVLTDAYVELGEYDKAVKMADIMISIKPDLRAYARISYIREIHGKVNEAIEAMQLAVEAGVPGHDDTAWAMQTLGDMYKMYGQKDKARKTYDQILVMRPDYPFALAAIGELSLDAKDYKTAQAWTQKAINIIPEVGFYTQMAQIYKSTGNQTAFDKIMGDIFEMLVDDEKSGHDMNLEYADIHLKLTNDIKQAENYAQREYNRRPLNIDVNRMMARISKAQNDQVSTKKYIAAASVTQSKHPQLTLLKINS